MIKAIVILIPGTRLWKSSSDSNCVVSEVLKISYSPASTFVWPGPELKRADMTARNICSWLVPSGVRRRI